MVELNANDGEIAHCNLLLGDCRVTLLLMIGDDLVIILISLQSILIVRTIPHLLEVLNGASNSYTLGPFRSDKI